MFEIHGNTFESTEPAAISIVIDDGRKCSFTATAGFGFIGRFSNLLAEMRMLGYDIHAVEGAGTFSRPFFISCDRAAYKALTAALAGDASTPA